MAVGLEDVTTAGSPYLLPVFCLTQTSSNYKSPVHHMPNLNLSVQLHDRTVQIVECDCAANIGMNTILDEIENTYKNHNYCSLCMYRPTC